MIFSPGGRDGYLLFSLSFLIFAREKSSPEFRTNANKSREWKKNFLLGSFCLRSFCLSSFGLSSFRTAASAAIRPYRGTSLNFTVTTPSYLTSSAKKAKAGPLRGACFYTWINFRSKISASNKLVP